jgi:hypothetical protein
LGGLIIRNSAALLSLGVHLAGTLLSSGTLENVIDVFLEVPLRANVPEQNASAPAAKITLRKFVFVFMVRFVC